MTPSEYEGTVAVNAAAQRFWAAKRHEMAVATGSEDALAKWEDLEPLQKNEVREFVLPLVWAALEALPDRVEGLPSEWGRRIKDDSLGNGHMVGHVTSLFKSKEDALGDAGNGRIGLFEDCELVVRHVSDWEVDQDVEAETVKDRMVVTFWLSDRARLDGKKPVMHAYGPFTLAKARRAKKEFDDESLSEQGMGFASVCKPIDVDAMNASDNKEE